MEPEDKLNLIFFCLAAPMSRPDTIELVCYMMARFILELEDTSTTSSDFFPVLDAFDPWNIAVLILRDRSADFWDPTPSLHLLNPTLSRFVNLWSLTIGCNDVNWDTLAATLSPLSSLTDIAFQIPASPTALCVRTLISGSTKLKSLVKVELKHIAARRGSMRQPEWSEDEGTWIPAADWRIGRSVFEFLNRFRQADGTHSLSAGPILSRRRMRRI